MGEKNMLTSFLDDHFLTIFLMAGFSMKLAMRKQTRDTQIRYLWLTVLCVGVLVVADSLEVFAAENPSLRFWRILFSVIGYIVRPVAALSVMLVVASQISRRKLLLWLPAILNALIMCTAFFSPVAFSYNADYEFIRGPLGYSVFIAGFFYIAMVLWYTNKRFGKGHVWESRVLYLCAISTALSAVVDAIAGGSHLNPAILISVVFYYMFIRTQDTNRDSVTNLLNRQSFYEDSELYQPRVTAVASLDMNGLKRLNDTRGHDAGDQALAAIGQCMLASASRSVIPYRMGGDEFAIVFLRQEEDTVRAVMETIQSAVREAGYSVAAGYACRTDRESINELYKLSDQKMYADKAVYYNTPGHNRRRRRD